MDHMQARHYSLPACEVNSPCYLGMNGVHQFKSVRPPMFDLGAATYLDSLCLQHEYEMSAAELFESYLCTEHVMQEAIPRQPSGDSDRNVVCSLPFYKPKSYGHVGNLSAISSTNAATHPRTWQHGRRTSDTVTPGYSSSGVAGGTGPWQMSSADFPMGNETLPRQLSQDSSYVQTLVSNPQSAAASISVEQSMLVPSLPSLDARISAENIPSAVVGVVPAQGHNDYPDNSSALDYRASSDPSSKRTTKQLFPCLHKTKAAKSTSLRSPGSKALRRHVNRVSNKNTLEQQSLTKKRTERLIQFMMPEILTLRKELQVLRHQLDAECTQVVLLRKILGELMFSGKYYAQAF